MSIRIEKALDGTLYFKDKHITWTLGDTMSADGKYSSWTAWFNGEKVAAWPGTSVPSDQKMEFVRKENSPWEIEKTLGDVMEDVEALRSELYWSSSKQQHMEINEMHTLHLVNAVKKELAKRDDFVDCLRDPWFRAALAELALWRNIPEKEEDEFPF